MKFSISLAGLLLCLIAASAQDSLKKANPIIYGEASLGAGITAITGFEYGFGVNYQAGNSLFTARYLGIANVSFSSASITPFTAIPTLHSNGSFNELGLLYGRRLINGGHSFSFSAGASLNTRVINYRDNNNIKQHSTSSYIGLPFEANLLWFKAVKKRYRIYNIIPVGKPTAFGNSIGFKLAGNVSQHSYLALGLVAGLGNHRVY